MSRRTIVVNGVTWKYRIGRSYAIAKSEDGVRKTISLSMLCPEYAQCDDLQPITPKYIARWLGI